MKLIRILFVFALIGLLGFSWPFSWLFTNTANNASYGSDAWVKKEIQILKSQARNIDDKVLRLALTAYMNANKRGYVRNQMLTVIDYSKPSTEKRLWVFDLKKNRTLYNTWVSHGKNSGLINATSFSNSPGSLKSSLGVFQTADTYLGKNGYSLRLHGLDRGINDYAYSRAIVIHGAPYANPANISSYGRIGRSWGCPAVDSKLAKPIINTIKERSIVFAYYPDRKLLASSRFLTA